MAKRQTPPNPSREIEEPVDCGRRLEMICNRIEATFAGMKINARVRERRVYCNVPQKHNCVMFTVTTFPELTLCKIRALQEEIGLSLGHEVVVYYHHNVIMIKMFGES